MSKLPTEFSDLEPFVEKWALPSERERNHVRIDCALEELDQFYNSVFPRIDAMLEYLNKRELYNLSESETVLMYLALSLAEVAPAVELFRSPTVPDGFNSRLFLRVDVPHQTPDISPA